MSAAGTVAIYNTHPNISPEVSASSVFYYGVAETYALAQAILKESYFIRDLAEGWYNDMFVVDLKDMDVFDEMVMQAEVLVERIIMVVLAVLVMIPVMLIMTPIYSLWIWAQETPEAKLESWN